MQSGLPKIYLLTGCILKFLITALPQHCESDWEIYNVGDSWRPSPFYWCTCTKHRFVQCEKLNEPICKDLSGNLRKNGETWKNSSCVACECVNGTINCTGHDVNVTYGLYSVELLPTCEKCAVPLRTLEAFSTCKGE